MEKISFIIYNKEVLEKSWQWLNDEEIRYLIQAPLISKEEQLAWFNQLENNPNYFIKGILYKQQIIGVVGLKKIDLANKTAEYFGYIGEKEYWGKGLGKEMIDYIKDYAKKELNLDSIYLKVISDNTRAIRAYEKSGFQAITTENNIIIMSFNL